MTEHHERTLFGVILRGLVGLRFNPSIRVPPGVDVNGNPIDA
jgi:hypothetical protein